MTKYKELREAAEAAEKDAPSPWRLAHDLELGWNLIEFDGWSKDLTLGAVWAGNGRDVAPCARHIALSNPQAVLSILSDLEAAESAVEAKDTAIVAGAETIHKLKAEITALRKQRDEAREALGPFKKMAEEVAIEREFQPGLVIAIRRAADIGGKDG
jgi:hypothetical protein